MSWKFTLFVLLILLTEKSLYAQNPYAPTFRPGVQPFAKSPVSPYLNLLRRGNSSGFNYVTLVRPQLQFQQSVQGLQRQLTTVEQSLMTNQPLAGQQGEPGLPPTGVNAGFMTHPRYFQTFGGNTYSGTNSGGFSQTGR